MPELQYAGTLPPLRTPHHPTADKTASLRLGEYREGVVVSHSEGGSLVDIGVENEAFVPHEKRRINNRFTVRISELGRRPKAAFANPSEIETYWGYTTTVLNCSLGQFLQQKQFDLNIATSKKGKHINSVSEELREKWAVSKKTLLAFGAPSQGLNEILNREHLKLEKEADFVVNTIPNQATETVRTEEALFATLSIFNTFSK
jgi:predicted SPOUT superfamily RNA methylase MTH1